MNQKICPHCKSKSYSSITQGKWICPSRQFEISYKVGHMRGRIPLIVAENADRAHMRAREILEKKYKGQEVIVIGAYDKRLIERW